MKRTMIVTAFLAMGLLVASSFAAAQDVTLPKSFFTGHAALGPLGASDVPSSKFTEYREVPKGVSMPTFSVAGSQKGIGFTLVGENVRQSDQQYFGSAEFNWLGISFDYNQTPHNMGSDGHTLLSETTPGVWSMSATLRKALGDSVDAVASSGRNFPFYSNLLNPAIASANSINLTSLRRRGEAEFDLGKQLPFDLAFTYMREVKSGSRGASGGDILGVVTSAVDVATPLNEVVQDIGARFAYKFKRGDVHATFNRNIFNNRQEALVIDNPFRASDLAYTSTSVPGGPGQVRFGMAPDNQASRGAFGFLLKFARQTRIGGDVALSRWTQNAQYLPYTINSAIFTPTGAAANNVASLQAQSLDGKINTTTVNLSFVSRPIEGLGIRMRYRTYDLSNKTTPIVWTGSTAGSPDRSWTTESPTADAPFGFATANPYSNSTKRFDAQASYDVKDVTFEAALRTAKLHRTYREATSGDQNGGAVSAVYHMTDLVGLRATYDWDHRTAEGETNYGFQSDEAERKTKRTGMEIELTPMSQIGFVFSFFRRNTDYPNRPNRVHSSGGVPVVGAQPIPDTPSGLLEANYDSYTVEFDFRPSERAEFSAYYTYEKDASTNQFSTTNSSDFSLNNLLRYAGTDKANTFGLNTVFHLVPEKWTLSLMATHQKVDGLMDITAREAGSFYTPGRTTLIPPGTGGAADITNFDDSRLTTIMGQLDYAIVKAWTVSAGYWFEKFSSADAFSGGTTIFPQSVLFFLKPNSGGYKANVAYMTLNYRF